MKRFLKIVGGLLLVVVLGLAGLVYSAMSGRQALKDGEGVNGAVLVKDGIVGVYLVEAGPGAVVLVDAGNDAQARPILSALARRGLTADAVKAILLTHGHGDHIAGVAAFPKAEVFGLAAEQDLVEGKRRLGIHKILPAKPTGLRIGHVVQDGETVTVGELPVRVFAVPGHTAGSAAFLARGILFVGDSADMSSKGELVPAVKLFSEDAAQNRASLAKLAERLAPMAGEVQAIACAHSGFVVRGLEPLTALAKRIASEK